MVLLLENAGSVIKMNLYDKINLMPPYVIDEINKLTYLSDNSRKMYIHNMFRILSFISDKTGIPINEIKRDMLTDIDTIKDYRDYCIKENHNKKTMGNDIKAISSIFGLGIKKDFYEDDNVEYYTDESYEEMLEAADILEDRIRNTHVLKDIVIFDMIRYLGLRASEVGPVLLKDISFTDKTIVIKRKKVDTCIKIPAKVLKDFKAYNLVRNRRHNSDYFIVTLQESCMCVRTVEIIINKYDPGIVPKKLRDLFAIEVYKKTGTALSVARALGITSSEAEKKVRHITNNNKTKEYVIIP